MTFFPHKLERHFVHLIVVLYLAVNSISLLAANYEQGKTFYELGEYHKAYETWLPLAKSGDMEAQFSLGTLYHKGEGINQENKMATHWFNAAAVQGHVGAQYNLGNAYKHGRGVEQNEAEAVRWWKKAAFEDLAAAQFNLGMQYYFGRGIHKDKNKAVMWYKRAAENGHKQARQLFIVRDEDSAQVNDLAIASGQPDPRREDRLLKQNPEFFTIQLASFKEQSNAVSFLANFAIKDSLDFFRIKNNDDIRYAVFYGSFKQKNQAEHALQTLPKNLRHASPWIRKFSVIQNLAKNVHRSF